MSLVSVFRSCWLIATFGCVLFIGGAYVLSWNEGQAVHSTISLNEALDDAITVDPNADLQYQYSERIVHVVGPITVGEPLTEPEYNIQVLAVKLRRRVQMYQWVEETIESSYGNSMDSIQTDGRTYYYTQEWRDNLIDSRHFYIQTGHRNPERFPVETGTQVAEVVYMGKFELGTDIKEKFSTYVELTSDTRPEDASIKLHQGLYYHTNNVFNPEIGDLRLMFSFAGMEGELYTIVGQTKDNKIVPYRTSRGIEVLLVYPGELSLTEVFKHEHHKQRLRTWGFRFMGLAVVFFGVTCTSNLLHLILSRINVVASVTPEPYFSVGGNLVLSFSMALAIASVAWVMHRPMYAAALILAAFSPFLWVGRMFLRYDAVV